MEWPGAFSLEDGSSQHPPPSFQSILCFFNFLILIWFGLKYMHRFKIQEVQQGIYTEKSPPAHSPQSFSSPVGGSWQFLVCPYRDIFMQANTYVDSSASFFYFHTNTAYIIYTVLYFLFFFKSRHNLYRTKCTSEFLYMSTPMYTSRMKILRVPAPRKLSLALPSC